MYVIIFDGFAWSVGKGNGEVYGLIVGLVKGIIVFELANVDVTKQVGNFFKLVGYDIAGKYLLISCVFIITSIWA